MHLRPLGISLTLVLICAPAFSANPPIAVHVLATAQRHRIDDRIYGVSFAAPAAISDLGITLNRWGGNRTTRYNWQSNWGNTAVDYYFENLDETAAGGLGTADAFVTNAHGAGAEPVLTIPMIGWTAKDATSYSFSVAKYGAQTAHDPSNADIGNGVLVAGGNVNNVPTDASMAVTSAFAQGWLSHLVSTFGSSSAGGVRYYSLDNEPELWNSSHRDVHPAAVGYDEAWSRMSDYGAVIRGWDANAWITGPEEWEWTALFDSAADWTNGNQVDRTAHGGSDYVDWLLQQAKSYEVANGSRILDVVTVHYYPQGLAADTTVREYDPENRANETLLSMKTLRNQSTRSLWDAAYVDQSWMGQTTYPGTATLLNSGKPELIPYLKQRVAADYPGTKVGITEYNWGADNDINGGTAQADILGIFGREGLDIGVRWDPPPNGSFTYSAFKLFRNYDGAHHQFGNFSVSCASTSNPDSVATFAALRSDGAMTVMLVSKDLSNDTPATVDWTNFFPYPNAAAQAWQLTSTNQITRLPDQPIVNGAISLTLPMESVTLLVIPGPPLIKADFNRDFQSDVLWHNSATGETGAWLMNGRTLKTGVPLPQPDPSWKVAAVADFDGDGQPDILWRNTTTGQVGVWLMNGTSVASAATLSTVPSLNWQIAGVGDVNGDGRADIFWWNSSTGDVVIWQMNGAQSPTGGYVATVPDTNWRIAAVGNLDGAAGTNAFWRNIVTGETGDWKVVGLSITKVTHWNTVADLNYQVVGIGDVDGDGAGDVIWRRSGTGEIVVWSFNQGNLTGAYLATVADSNWHIEALGDFDGDGNADLLWRNVTTGDVAAWLLDGLTIKSSGYVGTVGNLNWGVVAPK